MPRTDLAAPSVIDPAAFVFVAGVYFGSNPNEDFDALLGEWLAEKDDKAGWYSKRPKVLAAFPPLDDAGNFVRKGTCDHCGARFDWGAVYQHTSGKHIVVGNVCADKTLNVPTRLELETNRIKSRIAAARKAARNVVLAHEQAKANGFEWLYSEKQHGNATLDDIARKGLLWGSLSVKQIELVKRIHDGTPAEWQVKRAERDAQREAEKAVSEFVATAGTRVSGEFEILAVKSWDRPAYANPSILETVYWTLMKMNGRDLVTYKGRNLGERGAKITGKFTVKEHEEYNGAKQTKLQRPTIKEVQS